MTVPVRYILAALAFGVAALGLFLLPTEASADCNGCTRRPPPRCQQACNPTPPAPPPQTNCCAPPVVVVPPPHVPPPNVVVVNSGARAQAQASAVAIAVANVQTGDTIIRQNMVVESSAQAQAHTMSMSVAESAAEMVAHTSEREMLIQAICVDDRGNPHPASQTFGAREVAEGHRGELFRCMAGTRMRYTIGGQSRDCVAGQALWYENREVRCATQIVRRPCNERSLLRRFGAGEKMVRVRETEMREVRREAIHTGAMSMDGGVGGVGY
ncbi:MAG TPA: hypothetical protein PLK37_04670 [Terricaulis sp.]|nr:hypothetical protein [Terricaulis sp.]